MDVAPGQMMKSWFPILAVVMVMTSMNAMADRVPGRVSDLTWMAGYWTGPFGEEILEEHWMHPSKDSVLGTVRITHDGATRMMEFIAIEQVEDSLLFRVNQWLPGMNSLHEAPQVMTLKSIGDRSIAFESAGGFVFKTLAYSRPTDDRFVIDAELATGERLQLELVPR